MKKNRSFTKQQRKAVVAALEETLGRGKPADKSIQTVMRSHPHWTDEERAAVADAVYDIIRRWRLLVTAAQVEPETDPRTLDHILTIWMIYRSVGLPADESFNVQAIRDRISKFKRIPAIYESYPDWLFELGKKECGDAWPSIIQALNRRAPSVIRVNTLKTDAASLKKSLQEEGVRITPVEGTAGAFVVDTPVNIFRTDAFAEGLFEMQDTGSQLAGIFCNAQPGMRVVDACAGAGGKTLQLAAMMQNKGRIVALDIANYKLEELRRRARRAGVDIVEARVVDSVKVIKRLQHSADLVLVDAPCSGTGVLRRNPDIRWRMRPGDLERLHKEQELVLSQYADMVRPGGSLVYITCSVFPSEGEHIAEAFIHQHSSDWEKISEQRIDPVATSCDGFYMVMFRRKKA